MNRMIHELSRYLLPRIVPGFRSFCVLAIPSLDISSSGDITIHGGYLVEGRLYNGSSRVAVESNRAAVDEQPVRSTTNWLIDSEKRR